MPKILIADDVPFIRLLLEECLEGLVDKGAEILFAENGKDALDTIVRERPDLVFLDVMMPKMNGYEVCNAVKNELKINDVCIVMLTAKGQEFDRQKGNNAGADIYITKPFKPVEVVQAAEKALNMGG